MSGGIYLIHEREFVRLEEDVFKLGTSKNLQNRVKNYPKNSLVILQMECECRNAIEKDLLKIFREKFGSTIYGREYFRGNKKEMVKIITEYINEYQKNDNHIISKNILLCLTDDIYVYHNIYDFIGTIFSKVDENDNEKLVNVYSYILNTTFCFRVGGIEYTELYNHMDQCIELMEKYYEYENNIELVTKNFIGTYLTQYSFLTTESLDDAIEIIKKYIDFEMLNENNGKYSGIACVNGCIDFISNNDLIIDPKIIQNYEQKNIDLFSNFNPVIKTSLEFMLLKNKKIKDFIFFTDINNDVKILCECITKKMARHKFSETWTDFVMTNICIEQMNVFFNKIKNVNGYENISKNILNICNISKKKKRVEQNIKNIKNNAYCTNYPKIYEFVYWALCKNDSGEIIKNRNKFVEKYGIKYNLIGYEKDYFEKIYLYPTGIMCEKSSVVINGRDMRDHVEVYLNEKKEYVVVFSLYSCNKKEMQIILNNGYLRTADLYDDKCYSYVKILDMLEWQN
jgi:hypothetical protein